MIIPCPRCQARLNLPEDAAGSEVRCPGCRQVFRATPEAGPRAVEEGPPRRTYDPKPSRYPPLDDDPYDPPPRRRRFQSDRDLSEPRADIKVMEDNAREHTRFPGQVMLAAGFGTLGGGIVNRGIDFFKDFDQGLGPNNPDFLPLLLFGIVIRAMFFGPILLIMISAGRNLLNLSSRGMINAGIAMSFIAASMLAFGVLIDLLGMAALGGSSPLVFPQMAITALSGAASLTAGVLAIRALSEHHVRQFYDLQRESRYRNRY